MPATIWLQALDGKWERCGTDRLPAVKPHSLSLTANPAGPDTASFTLLDDGDLPRPDLSAFTPCRIESETGVPVWSGSVWETPRRRGSEPQITATGRGRQYHLDDDQIERCWVKSRLSDWVDSRQMPGANLANLIAAPQISTDAGLITLQVPQGTSLVNAFISITLDFKDPDNGPLKAVVAWQTSANGHALLFYARSSSSPNAANVTDYEDSPAGQTMAGASSAAIPVFTIRRRYLHLIAYKSTAATYSADVWVRYLLINVFREPAYESAFYSGLHADDVLRDLVPGLPLLAQDSSQIDPDGQATFAIPEFDLSGHATYRQVAEAVNAFHRWQLFVDAQDRLCFRPQPSIPSYVVDDAEFEDATASSGEEIFNKVLVQGTGPDGQPLRVERGGLWLPSLTQPSNPGFEVNTTGWSNPVPNTTLARSTARAHAGVASGLVSVGASFGATPLVETQAWTQAAVSVGLRYRISVWVNLAQDASYIQVYAPGFAGSNAFLRSPATNTWYELILEGFATSPSPLLQVWAGREAGEFSFNFAAGAVFYLDDVLAKEPDRKTLPGRRGFTRTKLLDVPSAMPAEAMAQVGDVFLATHTSTPFKGSVSIAPGAITEYGTGRQVDPIELVGASNRLIHFANEIDPDTGQLGRNGVIAGVTYDEDNDTASVQIDNQRDNLAALLERHRVLSER